MFLIGKQNENVFRNIVLMTDTVNFWFPTFWQVIYGKLRTLQTEDNAQLCVTFKCSATGITAQASFLTGQSIWKWNRKVQLSLKQPEQDDVLLMILDVPLNYAIFTCQTHVQYKQCALTVLLKRKIKFPLFQTREISWK